MTYAATMKHSPKIQHHCRTLVLPVEFADPCLSSVQATRPGCGSQVPSKEVRYSRQERSLPAALTHSCSGTFSSMLVLDLSEARQKQLMTWSRSPKRRPMGGIHNNPSPEVWKTNDFCFRQMGVSSYSSPMRLQLRGSRGINSSRRGKKQLAQELFRALS